MKKSSFTATVLGTVSGVLFALGMCMAMLPQWNAFIPGVLLGCGGVVMGLVTLAVWRKMEHKAPVKITGKAVLTVLLGAIGALAFGVGLCLVMVWNSLVFGVIIGLVGMMLLLSLIPLCKGLK